MQSEIIAYIDNRNMVALVMLDLSAAFDTIVLLTRLRRNSRISSDLDDIYHNHRCQCILVKNVSSVDVSLRFGVSQGSVLGPLLFSLYVSILAYIGTLFGLRYHCYADDIQLCVFV